MEINLNVASMLLTICVGIVTILTFIKTNAKNEAKRAADMAVLHNEQRHTNEKIDTLSKRVDKHNGFAERIPVLEQQMKVEQHRTEDLETGLEKANDRITNLTRRNGI